MKCSICSRRAFEESNYCKYHRIASLNLESAFAKWELAYGSLSWERYLESVSKLLESGDWVKEVALYELGRGK